MEAVLGTTGGTDWVEGLACSCRTHAIFPPCCPAPPPYGVQSLLSELGVPPTSYPSAKPQRAIFCSRTLNLRSIVAIGYDVRLPWLAALAGWWRGCTRLHGAGA